MIKLSGFEYNECIENGKCVGTTFLIVNGEKDDMLLLRHVAVT